MIGAWLKSGSAAAAPATTSMDDSPVKPVRWPRQTGLLRAVHSTIASGLLILAVLASSAVYTAAVSPYSKQYQIESIAKQDIMARVISGPNISGPLLGWWAASVTQAGLEDRVLSAAAKLQQTDKRLFVLATVARELFKTGNSEKARSVIDGALALLKTSSPEADDDGFRAVAEQLARVGRVQDALAVVEALSPDREDWKADGLRQVAIGRADAGDSTGAIAILDQITDLETRAQQYQYFIESRPIDDSAKEKAVDALLLLAPKVSDEHNWRSGSLSDVAGYLIDKGDADRGLQVTRSIPNSEFRAGSLVHVANAFIQSGKYAAAEAIINEAFTTTHRGSTEMAEAPALAQLGRLAHRPDATARAGNMLDAALISARKALFFPETAIGSVALGWAKLGNAEKCMAVLAEMPPSPYKANFFEPIQSSMQSLAALGLAKDALKVVNSMTEPYLKSLTLLALALTYDEAARRGVLLQVEALIVSITDEANQSFARSKVAEAWAQMGQYRYALQLSQGSSPFDRISVQQVILDRYIEREKP